MTDAGDIDGFRTISRPSREVIYKERKSKFYGYAFPLASEQEAGHLLDSLRKKHRNASHICYAWRLGRDGQAFRVQDDGEPTHSAGMPILGQLQAFELTYSLLVVVRIYGGTKLGVGPLANAYRAAARMALEASEIIIRHEALGYTITCPYEAVDKVLKTLRSPGIEIISQDIQAQCTLVINVRKREEARLAGHLQLIPGVTLSKTST